MRRKAYRERPKDATSRQRLSALGRVRSAAGSEATIPSSLVPARGNNVGALAVAHGAASRRDDHRIPRRRARQSRAGRRRRSVPAPSTVTSRPGPCLRPAAGPDPESPGLQPEVQAGPGLLPGAPPAEQAESAAAAEGFGSAASVPAVHRREPVREASGHHRRGPTAEPDRSWSATWARRSRSHPVRRPPCSPSSLRRPCRPRRAGRGTHRSRD